MHAALMSRYSRVITQPALATEAETPASAAGSGASPGVFGALSPPASSEIAPDEFFGWLDSIPVNAWWALVRIVNGSCAEVLRTRWSSSLVGDVPGHGGLLALLLKFALLAPP